MKNEAQSTKNYPLMRNTYREEDTLMFVNKLNKL
jgi:hypothetical protein